MTAYRPVKNANECCNSCASLAGLVLCFIACFMLLVIAPYDERVVGCDVRKMEITAQQATTAADRSATKTNHFHNKRR